MRSLSPAAFLRNYFASVEVMIQRKALHLSQLQHHTDPNQYVLYENLFKKRKGSFKMLHVKVKKVPIF